MAVLDLNDNYGYEDASLFGRAMLYLKRIVARGNWRALRHAEGQVVWGGTALSLVSEKNQCELSLVRLLIMDHLGGDIIKR